MISDLTRRSESITSVRNDSKTVQVNLDGLKHICTKLEHFGSSGEKLQNLIAEPFENELVQIASDLRYLEISYEELDRQEKFVGTLATIRSEGWQKKMTILAAVFAATGLGQLVPESDLWVRTGVFMVSLIVAIFVIWRISREK